MGKYLREVTIDGTKMFPNKDEWKQFNGETAYIDEAFYAKLKLSMPCTIRKLCIVIEPITEANKSFSLADANYDYHGLDIFIAKVPFDLTHYLNASDEQKGHIVYDLLHTFFNSPFAKIHFDTGLLLEILEEIKNAGFAHVMENKRRVTNQQKTKGVRYRKELTMHNMKVYALVSGKKPLPEEKILIGTIGGAEGAWSADRKSSIKFTDENTIAYFEQRNNGERPQLKIEAKLP